MTDEVLSELRRRSSERVAESEAFDEILERAAEFRDKNGVVQLADILSQDDESDAEAEAEASEDSDPETTDGPSTGESIPGETDSESSSETATSEEKADDEAADDDEPSPQQVEALQILIDHVMLMRNPATPSVAEASPNS